jgi:hypothetical protein
MKTFFFKYGEWGTGIKNQSFHTDFKNVNMILVKVHPNKAVAKKISKTGL